MRIRQKETNMEARKTFDNEFPRAWRRDVTREPSEIRAAILKQEGIQADCIRNALAMTVDVRRRMKSPLTKPFVALANPPDIRPAFTKQQEKFDAAATELVKLAAELAESEELRR